MGENKDLAVRGHDDEPELLNVGSDYRWQPQRQTGAIVAAAVSIVILLLLVVGNHNDDGVDVAPLVAIALSVLFIVGKFAHQATLRRWGSIKRDDIP